MPKKRFNPKAEPIQKTRVPDPLMQQVMQRLKEMQGADSAWDQPIARNAQAEAELNPKDDPAEGRAVTAKIIPPKKGM
jgi:hypothetical protein